MKIKRLLLGILLMQVATAASAADGPWYGAVDLGATRFQDVDKTRLAAKWQFDGIDDSGMGGRLSLGYVFNDSFALEAGYVKLGKARFDVAYRGSAPLPAGYPTRRQVRIDASAVSLTGVGSYHFSEVWSVSGRLAFIFGHVKLDGTESGNGGANAYTDSSNAFKFGYGFSLNWSFSAAWTARLGWDHYNVGDTVSTGSYVVDMTSVGLVYRF